MAELNRNLSDLVGPIERVATLGENVKALTKSVDGLNEFKWRLVGAFTLANILGVGAVVKLLAK